MAKTKPRGGVFAPLLKLDYTDFAKRIPETGVPNAVMVELLRKFWCESGIEPQFGQKIATSFIRFAIFWRAVRKVGKKRLIFDSEKVLK